MRFLLPSLLFYLLAVFVVGLARAAWRAAGRGRRGGPRDEAGPGAAQPPRGPDLSGEEITDADWREVDQ